MTLLDVGSIGGWDQSMDDVSASPSFVHVWNQLRVGGDEAAREIFERFAQQLIGLARTRLNRRLRQKVDAEDVVQSVFKSFFRRQADDQFQLGSWDNLWSLLTVLTIRKCANQAQYFGRGVRNVGREVAVLDSEALAREPTPEEAAMLADTIEQLLRGLNDRERQMAVLTLQGKTIPEISSEVGRAQRTVRRVVDQIRHRLEHLARQP